MSKYFALLTRLGADRLANAAALGTKIEITHMAVGDGGGSLPTPDTNQQKLINEKRRAAINVLSVDPKNTNQIIAEQVIPESEGGWWIREIGLFDKDGVLIAVGNCAETYKPQLQEGSGRTQTIRMVLIVSHTNAVTLKIDPSVVLATREYADASIAQAIREHEQSRRHPDATLKEKGFVSLSSAVNSASETQAATPKAVRTAYDVATMADQNAVKANNNANSRLEKARNGADIPNKAAFVNNLGFIAQQTGGSSTIVMSQKAVTDTFMKPGDFGFGGAGGEVNLEESAFKDYFRNVNTPTRVFMNRHYTTSLSYRYSAILYCKAINTYTAISAGTGGQGVTVVGGYDLSDPVVYRLWTDINTSTDKNGFLRSSGKKDTLTTEDLVQSAGTAETKVMSQKAVMDTINSKTRGLHSKLGFDNVVQTTGQSTVDVMSQKSVTEAFRSLQPEITGGADFVASSNTIGMLGVVSALRLEVGDVIQIIGAQGGRLFTVEVILNDNNIVVNFEHRNGAGSLSLTNETKSVTIKRLAKWYNAPIGLG